MTRFYESLEGKLDNDKVSVLLSNSNKVRLETTYGEPFDTAAYGTGHTVAYLSLEEALRLSAMLTAAVEASEGRV